MGSRAVLDLPPRTRSLRHQEGRRSGSADHRVAQPGPETSRTKQLRHVTVSPVFFYGLFMDADALRSKGAHPTNVRPAALPGYAIRIGNRATLVREPGSSAYGVLMDLPRNEIDALYSGPGLEAYRAEPVVAEGPDSVKTAALCFNLATPPLPGETNRDYADKLRDLARRLGLPRDYIERIR